MSPAVMRRLLFLDYDGTLTPIRKRPEQARLAPRRRKLLLRLARRPNIKIAIISGRRLAEIKKLVNISGLIYVGNHGLEIDVGERKWVHPVAKRFVPVLKEIRSAFKNELRYRGVLIEDKGLTLSAHYRLLARSSVPAFKEDFARVIKPWRNRVKITHGKKVIEVRPPVDWDKGKAVRWLIRELGLNSYFPIYIGDDKTDEDAFKALKGVGLSLKVGKGGRSRADDRLEDAADVYRFLSYYAKQREGFLCE